MTKHFSKSEKINLGESKTYNLDKFADLIHGVNCRCCSKREEIDTENTSSSSLSEASFQTMANYLTSGFWTENSNSTREWNLSTSGDHPKLGSGSYPGKITYNLGYNYYDYDLVLDNIQSLI